MPQAKHGSLTADAYNKVRSDILACRIRPNEKLVISDLCGTTGFSLGAVREALSRLTAEGLVIAEPRKGFKVAPISKGELIDLTRTRVLIERTCLANSIQHGDLQWETGIVSTLFELSRIEIREEGDPKRLSETWADAHKRFHNSLVANCDSPWLLRIREQLYFQSERYRRFSVPLSSVKRDTQKEHKIIADLTMAGKTDEACDALSKHLELTTNILIDADVTEVSGGADQTSLS